MMIKRILVSVCCLILLCGCTARDNGGTSSPSAPTVDYPALAYDITLDKCPQAVVSLLPEVTDIIVALGSDAQLAAISDNCVEVRSCERVGTAFSPDTERIKEMGTDLVFTSSVTSGKDIEILRNAGIAVAIYEAPARYTDLPAAYSKIATLISGGITGPRNAANTFARIDDKIKKHSNSSDFAATAAILVDEDMAIKGECVATDLAHFAGITVKDPQTAEIIICKENITDAVAAKYEGKRIVTFDTDMLDRRGADMYDTVSSLEAALKAR